MKHSPPLAASLFFVFCTLLIISGLSCSNQPTEFKLEAKYGPVGKIIQYKLDSHRVGTAYNNGEVVEEFDVKVEGDITYTAQKVLPDGYTLVLEENEWSWDEAVDDTGKVKRVTKDYAYKYEVSTTSKMRSLKMLGKPSQTWEDYVRSFTEQGMPVFPEEKISAGYQWTQTVMVDLPDSQTYEAKAVYIVKGIAHKQGYECAIIEYQASLALPLFPNPSDSMSQSGVDWIEMNGIMYFAIEAGLAINIEERRRVVSERFHFKGGKQVERKNDFEAVISQNLVSLSST